MNKQKVTAKVAAFNDELDRHSNDYISDLKTQPIEDQITYANEHNQRDKTNVSYLADDIYTHIDTKDGISVEDYNNYCKPYNYKDLMASALEKQNERDKSNVSLLPEDIDTHQQAKDDISVKDYNNNCDEHKPPREPGLFSALEEQDSLGF